MSERRFKSENYNLLGGMNNKVSEYLNSPLEFLNLVNLDFQTPGALLGRWGSTQYIGQTFPGKISALYEYTQTTGLSQVIIGHSGGLWAGATTGNSQGLSLTNVGVTLSRTLEYQNKTGNGSFQFGSVLYLFGDTSLKAGRLPDDTITSITKASENNSSNDVSFVTIDNWLFMADGTKFLKYNGISTYAVGLPPPMTTGGVWGHSAVSGGTLPGFGYSGFLTFYAAYVNNRGYEGPIWPVAEIGFSGATSASLMCVNAFFETPLQYGISAINIYTYWNATGFGSTGIWSNPRHYLNTYAASGSTGSTFFMGVKITEINGIYQNQGALSKFTTKDYLPLGSTFVMDSNYPTYVNGMNINPLAPKFLEFHQEKLFAFGFSSAPSTFVYSERFEPEAFPPEQFEEVRTQDGDYLTAAKSWNNRLYVFKKNSFHVYIGDDFENYELQEITNEYGCLNHHSVVTYENGMAFLDRSGIITYNGATYEDASFKVNPVFDNMNYNVALSTARMAHDKLRHQILCAIPVNGATLNNLTIVFDYNSNSWSTQEGFNPSVFARIQGRNQTKNIFYGTYDGAVNWFGASFLTDNGVGITTGFKTRFLHEMGDSVEKQFRQLYLNTDKGSTTLAFNVNFYQDYGASVVYSTSLLVSGTQNRIDFGIPAKSVAFEAFNNQTTDRVKINGFTVKYRKQRDT